MEFEECGVKTIGGGCKDTLLGTMYTAVRIADGQWWTRCGSWWDMIMFEIRNCCVDILKIFPNLMQKSKLDMAIKKWDMAIKKWESTLLGIKKWDCPS